MTERGTDMDNDRLEQLEREVKELKRKLVIQSQKQDDLAGLTLALGRRVMKLSNQVKDAERIPVSSRLDE